MDWAHLAAFNGVLLAALLSPGPAMLVALRTTLIEGRFAGMMLGLGLGTAAAVWTLMALMGLNAVFTVVPLAYLALKIIGAAYLIYLAVMIWRDAASPLDTATPVARQNPFLRGLFVNLSNPKSMLFAASVLVVIFPRDLTSGNIAVIVINHMVIEWLAYGAFALLLSTPAARNGYLRLKPVFDRVAATVLGALGLRLMLDRT
ncbi:LysE family translocator [Roseovarius aestuarii]|nr:LysE family translocator [Roseovarius aestuarii]